MIKILSKKQYDAMQSKLDSFNKKMMRYEADTKQMAEQAVMDDTEKNELFEKIRNLEHQLSEATKEAEVESESNAVTMTVSDDLMHVTPHVRINRDTFEKMVEHRLLDDSDEGNSFAMQLAVMNICYEALQQIIESFSQEIEHEE